MGLTWVIYPFYDVEESLPQMKHLVLVFIILHLIWMVLFFIVMHPSKVLPGMNIYAIKSNLNVNLYVIFNDIHIMISYLHNTYNYWLEDVELLILYLKMIS